MGEVKELHFTISEDFGILLSQIAQEHLLYNFSPEKAVTAITDSLMGCPVDLALEILKGDKVITVDVDSQTCSVSEFIEGIHDKIGYNKPDLVTWYNKKLTEIVDNGFELKKLLEVMIVHMKYRNIHKSYDFSQIIKFIRGDVKEIYDDIMETSDVDDLYRLTLVTKRYLETSVKIKSVLDWIRKTYSNDFDKSDTPEYSDYFDIISTISRLYSNISSDKFKEYKESEFTELDNYMESVREINEVIEKGIEPVNILDNWSAGWLSPEGEYYALNGEIANMLHLQIADALQKIGVIPSDDELKSETQDSWLEKNGWVKIHDDNINFAGCLNIRLGGKNVNLTEKQIDLIYQYGQVCCGGKLKMGWKRELISAAKFEMIARNNMQKLNSDYFEF